MSRTSLSDGAGCLWWRHDGNLGADTFPNTELGVATTTPGSSLLLGAKVVVIYSVIVVSGAALDTFSIRTYTSGGVGSSLTGFSAVPCATTGVVYRFPGGLRVQSTHASVAIGTTDASVLTVFYRKIA